MNVTRMDEATRRELRTPYSRAWMEFSQGLETVSFDAICDLAKAFARATHCPRPAAVVAAHHEFQPAIFHSMGAGTVYNLDDRVLMVTKILRRTKQTNLAEMLELVHDAEAWRRFYDAYFQERFKIEGVKF